MRPEPSTAVFWISEEHTTAVIGEDPVVLHRIKAANTVLGLIAFVDLRREPRHHSSTHPPGRGDPKRPGQTPPVADRWWCLRIGGAVSHRLEVLDRSPNGIWLVDERQGVTTLVPTTVVEVIGELCDALGAVTPTV